MMMVNPPGSAVKRFLERDQEKWLPVFRDVVKAELPTPSARENAMAFPDWGKTSAKIRETEQALVG